MDNFFNSELLSWTAGQPDNKNKNSSYVYEPCVEMTSSGLLNDISCTLEKSYICQIAL